MKINQLIQTTHDNAIDKGFHQTANIIRIKLVNGEVLTTEEIQAVTTAFEVQRIALIMTELAEAVEALRHGDRENYHEEIADTAIRIADHCGESNIDLEKVIIKKMAVNKLRSKLHGKLF